MELKIDELLERQKVFENQVSSYNKILLDEIKRVKQDIGVSSVIFGSVNNLSHNITKNTKQIHNIKDILNDYHKNTSQSIDTLIRITTHGITSLVIQELEKTNEIRENNKNVNLFIDFIKAMFGIVPNNYVMQYSNQTENDNIVDNNVIEDNKENEKIENDKINDFNTMNNYKRDNEFFFKNKFNNK